MVGPAHTRRVLVLYASQTGNAEAIAHSLHDLLWAAGVRVQVRCCGQGDAAAALRQACCLVLVAATTGDGDPPDSARKLWKQLRRWSGVPLTHLSYTVLGLGDTNYTNFCNFGKSVDCRLSDLGAQRFYRCGWADDGTGLEVVVEPWCEGLTVALETHLASSFMQVSTPPNCTDSPNFDTPDVNIKPDGGNINKSVSRAACNSEELNSDQEYKSSVYENNRSLEMAVSSANEDAMSEVLAHHNIDMLPQSEVECLPLRCCAFSKDDSLSLSPVPPPYLTLTLAQDNEPPPATITSSSPLPAAASEVVKTRVHKVRQLTHPTAVKTALEFTLELPTEGFAYQPGDSFGVVVKNPQAEVELLLSVLRLSHVADKECELSIIPGTKKRSAAVPSFLPPKSSIRHLLECCVDIRAVPKKPFLRALAEYTTESCEKRRLLELVSKEGATEYTCHVREACLSTLDLMLFFRSCRPPITTLLEHLPRLLPRPYSAASSPLTTPNHISFVFNVIDIPRGSSVAFSRQGLCTGWLASLASINSDAQPTSPNVFEAKDIEKALNSLTLASQKDIYVDIYLRNNHSFRPPVDPSVPVVMVGPGTGVAPFLGFLQHRHKMGMGTGEWWLFYGCRHKDKDYLYQNELEKFEKDGVLNHLIVSYSRETDSPKYVQDNLIEYGALVAPLLDKATVYVCGDARNMAKDVFEAFVSVLINHNELTETDARKMLSKMMIDKRYLQDVWM